MRWCSERVLGLPLARPVPGQHGGVGVVGLLPLSVLADGRRDLSPDLGEVIDGVEVQLDVIPLQSHQVVRLRQTGQ